MTAVAIVVGGGRGERFSRDLPKQFHPLAGKMVIEFSLAAFAASPSVKKVIVVVPPSIPDSIVDVIFSYRKVTAVVPGGATRQLSVKAGLMALRERPDIIVVHDAARPLVDVEMIEEVIAAARESGAAIPALPISDSVKYSKDGTSVGRSVPRDRYFRAQTPQAFHTEVLLQSSSLALENSLACTDEAQMVEVSGKRVSMVRGRESNIKITDPQDMVFAKALLGAYTGDLRVGLGYDAHRLVKGRKLHLGGIEIEWEFGLLGHSDGDCALHAIADALLGAAGLGDIGYFFPPEDESLEGISSLEILTQVGRKVEESGFRVINVDTVIICQRPRISDFSERMAGSIAGTLGVDREAVSVKGKTTEGMGFEGSGEGISSIAVALLEKIREEG